MEAKERLYQHRLQLEEAVVVLDKLDARVKGSSTQIRKKRQGKVVDEKKKGSEGDDDKK